MKAIRGLAVFAALAAGCSGIIVGRPGPGRGAITIANAREYYASGSSGPTVMLDDVIGAPAAPSWWLA